MVIIGDQAAGPAEECNTRLFPQGDKDGVAIADDADIKVSAQLITVHSRAELGSVGGDRTSGHCEGSEGNGGRCSATGSRIRDGDGSSATGRDVGSGYRSSKLGRTDISGRVVGAIPLDYRSWHEIGAVDRQGKSGITRGGESRRD